VAWCGWNLVRLRHLTRTSVQAELAAPPDGLAGLPGVHDLYQAGDGQAAREGARR
jgi:ABC-2 type transport system ATP-binding protein